MAQGRLAQLVRASGLHPEGHKFDSYSAHHLTINEMEHKIKVLAEAITNTHTSDLVHGHVKELKFEDNHLTIYIDNAGPLHELESEEYDHHLQSGMEKVYGDITYELKLSESGGTHEREKEVPHNINQ